MQKPSKVIYENRSSNHADVSDFIMGRMRLEGIKSNFVFWCGEDIFDISLKLRNE